MKKILVVAPHADDEILGLGGYLYHQSRDQAKIHVVFVAVGGRENGRADQVELRQRKKEMINACCKIGVKNVSILHEGYDGIMDIIPDKQLISLLDREIAKIEPDELFLPYPSHHQDHKKTHNCGMAAIRIKEGYNVPDVYLYEYPFVGSHYDYINGGRFYHDISDCVDLKIEAFEKYGSQVREMPSPINDEGIKALARIRGLESGNDYAEMFYLQRMIR